VFNKRVHLLMKRILMINIDLQKMGWRCVDWIDLTQDGSGGGLL